MTNKQLADAYNVTLSAVTKWPKERRDAAKLELQAGVDPEIKRLFGELAQECYVTNTMVGSHITADYKPGGLPTVDKLKARIQTVKELRK